MGTSNSLAHSLAIFQQHTLNSAHGPRQKSKPAASHEKHRKGELGTYIPAGQPEFLAVYEIFQWQQVAEGSAFWTSKKIMLCTSSQGTGSKCIKVSSTAAAATINCPFLWHLPNLNTHTSRNKTVKSPVEIECSPGFLEIHLSSLFYWPFF